ncbi:MAG: CBS domain-containing protein [Candidatus Woesearchaeota archaeon]
MIVKEAMHNITKVPAYSSVTQIAAIMSSYSIGSVLIEENQNTIGIVTERDILNKVVAAGKNSDKTIVKEIMTSPLITIDVNSPIEEASYLINKHKTRRLIVTENEKIVGIITARNIAESLRFSFIKRRSEYERANYR